MSDEENQNMAPGLIQAFNPEEKEEPTDGHRRRRNTQDDPIMALRNWTPKTRLGNAIMAGRIITFEQALASRLPIREVEVIDALIPNLEDNIIKDACFKTYGCGSAIASSSLLTEWVKGKTLGEAKDIKNTDIVEELSFPPVKIHCSVLAEDAIRSAIKDYENKERVHR